MLAASQRTMSRPDEGQTAGGSVLRLINAQLLQDDGSWQHGELWVDAVAGVIMNRPVRVLVSRACLDVALNKIALQTENRAACDTVDLQGMMLR